MADAEFRVEDLSNGVKRVILTGAWSLRGVQYNFSDLRDHLAAFFGNPFTHWDLSGVEQLDSAAAVMLWTGWGKHVDQRMLLRPEHTALFDMLAALPAMNSFAAGRGSLMAPLHRLWNKYLEFFDHLVGFLNLVGNLMFEFFYILRHPRNIPFKEISANFYKGGVQALPVTALVSLMIGVAMGYLMTLQLRKFGADIFIVNIIGLAGIRELGPILMSIIVAGRSGSAMTAQIGVMHVTEEIDALSTMGISRTLRLILPKVIGLSLAAPLLAFWTSAWVIFGGMLAARMQLGISMEFFLDYLPRVVLPVSLALSVFKGFTFGVLVTLIACHFGMRIKPNTESLSASTTSSVVTAITTVILVDAIFAIVTRRIGL
ncbi:MAG: ABC transporter permease [Gallionella sp.]|nr:ABC transporter permease [Gallionella sp.]